MSDSHGQEQSAVKAFVSQPQLQCLHAGSSSHLWIQPSPATSGFSPGLKPLTASLSCNPSHCVQYLASNLSFHISLCLNTSAGSLGARCILSRCLQTLTASLTIAHLQLLLPPHSTFKIPVAALTCCASSFFCLHPLF